MLADHSVKGASGRAVAGHRVRHASRRRVRRSLESKLSLRRDNLPPSTVVLESIALGLKSRLQQLRASRSRGGQGGHRHGSHGRRSTCRTQPSLRDPVTPLVRSRASRDRPIAAGGETSARNAERAAAKHGDRCLAQEFQPSRFFPRRRFSPRVSVSSTGDTRYLIATRTSKLALVTPRR